MGAAPPLDGDTSFTLARQAYRAITIPSRFLEVDREITMKPDEIVSQRLKMSSLDAAEFVSNWLRSVTPHGSGLRDSIEGKNAIRLHWR
jgi:hypothetical protein